MPLFTTYIPPDRYPSIAGILPVIRAGFPKSPRDEQLSALRTIDWTCLADFSTRHRILPILYHNLKTAGLAEGIPESVQTVLRMKYMRIVGANMRMARRLADLCALFEERRIPVIPFKGPVLAQILYGDSALRYCQDLDVLAPRRRLPEIWRLLHEAGYRPHDPPFTQNRFQLFARYGNEFELIDAAGFVALDLHWKIAKHTRRAFDMEFCEPRLRPFRFYGRAIRRLSDEDTVLALCLNGGFDLWPHLENVLSLADFLKARPGLDWRLLQDLARRLRCERRLRLGLFLAADLFAATLPSDIAGQVERDRMLPGLIHRIYQGMFQGRRTGGRQAEAFRRLRRQMDLQEHAADKIRYVLRRVFIPTAKDWKAWSVDTRSVHPFLLLRPLNGLLNVWREIRGKRAK